jgi:hypothetical protein
MSDGLRAELLATFERRRDETVAAIEDGDLRAVATGSCSSPPMRCGLWLSACDSWGLRHHVVRTLFGRLRSEHPDDCILSVLDRLLLGVPLPFHQVRHRFPLMLDLIADRLALSLPLVSDLDAPLLFGEIRECLLLGLDQVLDRSPFRPVSGTKSRG